MGFLALMLSLSQVQFWPDWYPGFQDTITPTIWSGPFRILGVGYRAFVQHAWPAALLFASAQFYRSRKNVYWMAMAISALFLAAAILQAVLEIAWSEDYRRFVFLHAFLTAYSTEFTIASFAAVAIVCWFWSSRFGLTASLLSLLASGAFYWSASPITKETGITTLMAATGSISWSRLCTIRPRSSKCCSSQVYWLRPSSFSGDE